MNNPILEHIASRHCKRSFLDKPVEQKLLESALTAAQQAPSSKNTQSWKVAIVSGAKRDELSEKLCELYDNDAPAQPDYVYMHEPMEDLYKQRARECGFALFELKGIGRKDFDARKAHGRENFTFFGAPLQMIFHLPKQSEPGMFLDMGLYMQSLMLALSAVGLGSCPQFSIASYPDAIRECLNLGEDRQIVSGMSVGYVNEEAKVNTFIPKRADLSEVVDWKA